MHDPDPARPLPSGPDAAFARHFTASRPIILGLAALAGLVWITLFLQFTADDAYISFRYARTLVASHLWNWNPAGPHEEAYTSAVYTLLAILPAALHISPAIFMKLFGLACLGTIVFRLHTLALSRFASLLGILVLAVHPWVWTHSFSGLETPLYMLLVLEMAICVDRPAKASPIYVYALFLILPLTRPEGIVVAILGVAMFWRRQRNLPNQLPWLAASVILGATYFLVRWHYFHHLLPNPFYVKVAHTTTLGLVESLIANLSVYKEYFLTLALILMLARRSSTRAFALCSLGLMLALFAPHAMPMNYDDRFYFQLTLPVVIFFFLAEDLLPISRFAGVIATIFLLALSPGEAAYSLRYFPALLRAHVDIGRRLAPYAAGHTMIAGDTGAIPYFSNWFTYDFVGLATNSMARQPLTQAQLATLHPDLIIVYNAKPGDALLIDNSWAGPDPAARTLVDYIRDSGQYQYAGAAKAYGFYLVEFLRKDTPQHDQILATLQENEHRSAESHFSFKDLLLQRYVPWHD